MLNWKHSIAFYAGMLLIASQAMAQQHPNLWLSQGEIDAILKKVQEGKEPWKSAFGKIKSDADKAMGFSPKGIKGSIDGEGRLIWSRDEYGIAMSVKQAIRSLGLGYAFLKDDKYADKTIAAINKYVNETKTGRPNQQTSIYLGITIPGILYGGNLIWNYPGWNSADRDKFKQHCRKFYDGASQYKGGPGNQKQWHLVMLMSSAVCAEYQAGIDKSIDDWKEAFVKNWTVDGLPGFDHKRSFGYVLFCLKPAVQFAEIARHYNANLYEWKSAQGHCLENCANWAGQWMLNPSSYPYSDQKCSGHGDCPQSGVALYELMCSWKKVPKWKEFINKYGRPIYDSRTMGPVTLTHAEGLGWDGNAVAIHPEAGREFSIPQEYRMTVVPSANSSVFTLTGRLVGYPASMHNNDKANTVLIHKAYDTKATIVIIISYEKRQR